MGAMLRRMRQGPSGNTWNSNSIASFYFQKKEIFISLISIALRFQGYHYNCDRNLLGKKFYRQDDQAKNKDQQTDPVDAVHVADPLAFGAVRIFLFQVEVLGHLS